MADMKVKVTVNIFKDPTFQQFQAAHTVQQEDVAGRPDRKNLTFVSEDSFKAFCRKFGFYLR